MFIVNGIHQVMSITFGNIFISLESLSDYTGLHRFNFITLIFSGIHFCFCLRSDTRKTGAQNKSECTIEADRERTGNTVFVLSILFYCRQISAIRKHTHRLMPKGLLMYLCLNFQPAT